MKTAFQILARDLKRLLRNPVALAVVFGLVFLPSLYAWYCIESNWNPYDRTNGLKVAVVNNDKPAKTDQLGTLDVGGQVEETLRADTNFAWEFVSEDEAMEKLDEGYYYAAIVIPKDFSKDFTSILTGTAKNPTIDYYVNEKYSAVATKVTDVGASTIERQVNSTFVSTVSKVVAETAQTEAKDVSERVATSKKGVSAKVEKVDKQLEKTASKLRSASSSTDDWRTAADNADGMLDNIQQSLPQLKKDLKQAKKDLRATRDNANQLNSELLSTLNKSALGMTKSATSASTALEDTAGTVDGLYGTTSMVVKQLDAVVASNEAAIDELKERNTDGSLDDRIAALEKENKELKTTVESVRQASQTLDTTGKNLHTASSDVTAAASKGSTAILSAGDDFTAKTAPAVASNLDTYALILGSLSSTVNSLEPQVKELRNLFDQMDEVLTQTKETLDSTADALDETRASLQGQLTDLNTIVSSLRLQELSSLTGLDPDQVGEFMASPVTLEAQTVYPMSPYGSAVAPFYTNLALWVGCFMLIAVLRAEVDREGFPKMTARQAYLGRFLLMLLLAIVQSVIMLAGELVMGVQCTNVPLFFLTGAIISFSYISVVFALAITFKHIGKALAVIMLIFQIPGSSGMYPVEMMPHFFQWLHPLLPFTYGIAGLREVIGGMYGSTLANDLAFLLLVVVPASLFLGLVLRKYFLNTNLLFDKRLRETDVLDHEVHGTHHTRYSIHNVFRALLDSDSYRERLLVRAARFNRFYPHVRGLGALITAGLPLLMIVVMAAFQVESIDAKIIMLCAVLIAIVVVDVALIMVEYTHDNLNYQLRVTQMGEGELMDAVYQHMPVGVRGTDVMAEEGESGWRARSRAFRERIARTVSDARIDLDSPTQPAQGEGEGEGADAAASMPSAGKTAGQSEVVEPPAGSNAQKGADR